MNARVRLLGSALVTVALGGCTISTGSPPAGSADLVRERFEQTQQVHLDLRQPITRAEVGVRPGDPGYIVERAGEERFLDVELTLPGDGVLAVPAIGVVFANDVTAPDDGPIQEIVVNRVEPDLVAAEEALLAAVPLLALQRGQVEEFFARQRGDDGLDSSVFLGARLGYLTPEVEVFYRGPERRVAINYTLTWDAAPDRS